MLASVERNLVTKGAIYWYFGGKDGLIRGM